MFSGFILCPKLQRSLYSDHMQNIDIALKVFSLCYGLQIILCDKVTILKIRCADFVIKGNYEPCVILLSVQAVG